MPPSRPVRTLASVLAAGVVAAGLAVVGSTSTAAVAADATCEQSVIRVSRTSTGQEIGYLGAEQGSSGTTLRTPRTVATIDDALRFHDPAGTTSQNLAIVGREAASARYLGLSAAVYDSNYTGYLRDRTPGLYPELAHVVYTTGTAVGATPQYMSWGHQLVESAVWNVAADGRLSVRWINPDGSVASGVKTVASGLGEGTMATAATFNQQSTFHLQPACDQHVTLTAPAQGWVGGSAAIQATTSVPSNPVSYESRTPQVCTVSGGRVAFGAAGTCVVAAVQAASGPWLAAEGTASITVRQDVLVDALILTPPRLVLGERVTATYTAQAASAQPRGTVEFRSAGRTLGTVALVGGVASLTFTPDSVGDLDVEAVLTSSVPTVPSGTERARAVVVQRTPTAVLTVEPTATVVGQPATATYEVRDADYETTGTVQFTLDGQPLGAPVAVVDGVATSPVARPQVGVRTVGAEYVPDRPQLAGTQHTATLEVQPASTTSSVSTTADELLAEVAVVEPGEGSPTGTVVFRVAGAEVGRADLVEGRATLAHRLPAGSQGVSVEYLGDGSYLPSSASTVRDEPVITTTLTGRRGDNGWFRGPVTVEFSCTPTTAALVTACPEPVVVSRDTAGRTVTGTVHAADGGVATASVRVAVDSVAPAVRLTGVRAGSIHLDRPSVSCVARDGRSGLASCRTSSQVRGKRVVVRAVATDRAGNVSRARTHYVLTDLVVRGARHADGVWHVRRGRTYTLLARSGSTPRYVYAAPAGRSPHGSKIPFAKVGKNRWALPVGMRMAVSYSRDWRLGVVLDGKLREVRVRVHG